MAEQPYTRERRQLVEAAFRGERGPRPLISLWRHWPLEDQDPAALARAHADFQRRYDFDFVKFTPSGTDVLEDMGAETAFAGDPHGTRDVVRRAVRSIEDWRALRPGDRGTARLWRQVAAIGEVRQQLGELVPLFQTVFSPLTVARRLAGERLATDLREHPEAVLPALERIVEETRDFVAASLEAGADGLFFVTQAATRDLLTEEEHARYATPGDLAVLEAARARTELVVLHAHGSNLMFDQLLRYPVRGLNWHDRAVGPSIAQLRERFAGLLLGGVDEWGCLLAGPADAIRAQIRDAVEQSGQGPLCLAAGCVIGYRTPDRNIRAARAAIKNL